MSDLLIQRLMTLRAFDLMSLARQLKGGPAGIDMNRKFKNHPDSPKRGMAEWLLSEFAKSKIEEALPAFEADAAAYRAKQAGKPAANLPPPQPIDPPPIQTRPPAPPGVGVSEARVRDIAREEAQKLDVYLAETFGQEIQAMDARFKAIEATKVIRVEVVRGEAVTTTELGPQHKQFDLLLKLATCRKSDGHALNIWITGPAGSGKTRAAFTVAQALGVPFHFTGAVDNEYKLLGFVDAQGRAVRTAFREAYEKGGVFLLDEVDGCHASAVLALNAALANGMCDFPDGTIPKHPDCVIMATANTWGTGATHDYIGRTKLDSASLDRFVMLAWEYDEDLERATSGNVDWARKVQTMRSKVTANGIRHIISPRATYDGTTLLAAGMAEADVMTMLVRRGLSDSEWNKVKV